MKHSGCVGSVTGQKRFVHAVAEGEHSPFLIPMGATKRYFGLLLTHEVKHERSTTRDGVAYTYQEPVHRPELLLTPYMTAYAHKTMVRWAQKRGWNEVRSLWLGELEVANEATNDQAVQIRAKVITDVSGEWARLLMLNRGETLPSHQMPILRGHNHQNSIANLEAFFRAAYPHWLDSGFERRAWTPQLTNMHLYPELDRITALFKKVKVDAGENPMLANVNHDIRNPMLAVCGAIELLNKNNNDPAFDIEVWMLLLNNSRVVIDYLTILQKEYPADKNISEAIHTLDFLLERHFVVRSNRSFTVPELNELLNVKEVLEFVSTVDIAAIQWLTSVPVN